MIKIELNPQTACLMLVNDGELINCKFYNKLAFDHGDIENEQIEADKQTMINDFLKTHINNMLTYYRWYDHFSSEDIETLIQFVDYTEQKISKLINKFSNAADNGGAPVLKQILQLL